MTEAAIGDVGALTFDVFGTVVDWRSGLARDLGAAFAGKGIATDPHAAADAWYAEYAPAIAAVREGRRPWTSLDVLLREGLERALGPAEVARFAEPELAVLAQAWERLDPWPDVLPGLARLRRRFVLATLSNGNVALLVAMARRAGLAWDAVLGAEFARSYKPDPRVYLATATALGLPPRRCLMVAAHEGDLAAAGSVGFRTALIRRPRGRGPGGGAVATGTWDVAVDGLDELALRLGC